MIVTLPENSPKYRKDLSWLTQTVLVGSAPLSLNFALADNLLISGSAGNGRPGGMFSIGRGKKPTLQVLDRLETTGIWLDDKLLVRSVQHTDHMILFFYGPESVWSLATENYKQVHDVRYQFGQLYVVSTSTNEVVQLSMSGELLYKWKFPGEGDAWHLNCLDLWDGRYVISAFGKFEKERQFKGGWKGAGILFDLETQDIIWDGLSLPHTPRKDADGREFICDSATHRMLMRHNGQVSEFLFPDSFTRGMAFGANHIYLGLSMLRPSAGSTTIPNARIVVLDRQSLKQVGQIDLPCPEVYDIIVVPS